MAHVISSRNRKFEGIEFTLEGNYLVDPERPEGHEGDWPDYWSETFTSLPIWPALAADTLQGTIVADEQGNRIYRGGKVIELLRLVLDDEQTARFDALVEDKNRLVDNQQLADAIIYVMNELGKARVG